MILLNLPMMFLSGMIIESDNEKTNKHFFRSINHSPHLRHFWTSRLVVDGNNYDFSQGESCLRNDISWHVGLRDHSIHFVSLFDKLLSSINDENLLLSQIRSLRLLQNISTLDYDSLQVYY
jgi:hypothetical protein